MGIGPAGRGCLFSAGLFHAVRRGGLRGRGTIDVAAARQIAAQGLFTLTDTRLTVTEAGAILLDAILPRIVLDPVTV
mgnify:CR=1 FL=1